MQSLLLQALLNNCSQKVYLIVAYKIQLNLSTSATLGIEESSHYWEVGVEGDFLFKRGFIWALFEKKYCI